jgi:RHS repeat-associated protein
MQPSDQNGTVRQDVRWMNVSNVDINRFKYGFSRASNRLWRQNTMTTGFDEQYIYDNLYQVNERLQGTLSGGVITGTPVEEEQFTLDPTGNWSGYAISGDTTLSQTRTHQEANEISAISPSGSTGYDDNGNMTTMPKVDTWGTAQTVTYDAWNRPITVVQSSTTLGTYAYDGLNRRVTKISNEGTSTTRHFYYSKQWQVLEERTGSATTADRQYVWGTRYVDDLVLRDRFVGTADRFYALADYFQPTAIANTSGVVEERYVYRAFGDVSYYNGSFSSISSSAYDWTYLYGSYPIDLETNLYPVRNRYYHSALGRWLTRDPFVDEKGNDAELTDQGTNLYWYVQNNAVNQVDALGLATCCCISVTINMGSWKWYGTRFGVNVDFAWKVGGDDPDSCQYGVVETGHGKATNLATGQTFSAKMTTHQTNKSGTDPAGTTFTSGYDHGKYSINYAIKQSWKCMGTDGKEVTKDNTISYSGTVTWNG